MHRRLLFLFLSLCFVSLAAFSQNNDSDYDATIKQSVALLQKYIRIPSISGDEGQAGKFLSSYCEEVGLHVFRFSQDSNRYNFSASLYPLTDKKPNIILLNHIDVVSEGEISLWKYPPFAAVLDSMEVWGRGAIDMKGQAIMQLMALLNLKERATTEDLPYNVTLLSVSGEERDSQYGIQVVLDHFLELLNPVVVLGEGGAGVQSVISSNPDLTVFGVSIAEKMSVWLRLTLDVQSAGHGATPTLDYANLRMISALNKLNTRKTRLRFHRSTRLMFRRIGKEEGGIRGFFIGRINWSLLAPIVKRQIKNDPLYRALLTNTITVTQISNPPGPPNQISMRSEAYLDCRLLPGQNKKAFIRRIKNILDEDGIIITEISSTPEVESTRPDEFFDVLAQSIESVIPNSKALPFVFPATTDNSYFREKDIPTYGLIPAILNEKYIDLVHAPNERIHVDMIKQGIDIYTAFLNQSMELDTEKRKLIQLRLREKRERLLEKE